MESAGPAVDVPPTSPTSARFERLFVRRSEARGLRVTTGCYRAPLPLGWAPELDEPALDKLSELAAFHGGAPLAGGEGAATPTPSRDLAGPRGRGRAIVAFADDGAAHACFAACDDATGAGRCDAMRAEIVGGSPPQAASPPLAALVAALHHPRTAVGVLASALALVGAILVRRRPRPTPR
ncbi:MAG: hypothetical protein JNL38_11745 [Myxococcales bacterium]|nr:hypothetical protein [Myxococcales bacterium]